MLWIVPTWLISLILAYLLGYYLKGLSKKIIELEQSITMKQDKKIAEPEPVSSIIDPLDPIQTAIYEREQEMKRLNP